MVYFGGCGGVESQGRYKSQKYYKNSRGNRHLLIGGYFSAKNACKNLIINLYRFFSVKKALEGIFWGVGGGGKPGEA